MKVVIQRVKYSKVEVAGEIVSAIDTGIMALVGLEPQDKFENCKKIIDKIIALRIFSDEKGHLNLSISIYISRQY